MSFFTEIQIPEFPYKMDYSKSIMFFGSCFSENIGQKMFDRKFKVDTNPFGILYNPESIASSLKLLLNNRVFTEDDLFFDQGLWNSFYHHSRFSDVNREVALEKINSRIQHSNEFLREADFLVITFGTAWVYELIDTGQIVSNCHKIPAKQFSRYRLGVNEISETYHHLLEDLWKFNPNLKIIFTVSPIRHWKDGAIENQVSKSTLLLAIDRLITGLGDRGCRYFPSYELMMDELRDYRFYAEDMIHLNPVAIDYIFDRFNKFVTSKESMDLADDVMKVMKAVSHRPVNPSSMEYKKFLLLNLDKINKLTLSFPHLNFDQERIFLRQKLIGFQE